MASTPSQNKKSSCETMEQDKISNLTEYVLDQILSCLPIKDLVRTSVLSTKWRYKWASVTSLVIDDNRIIGRIDQVIDDILFLHMGPIHKFKLSCWSKKIPPEKFHKWILYLSRHSINELVLHLQDYVFEGYLIPPSLFCCQGLTHLDLDGFSLFLPSDFDGFKNLKSLTLRVEMVEDVEELISRSPLLERLTLCDVFSIDQLNIHGPNLLYFYINGHFVDICFKTASRLTELYINVEEPNNAFEIGDIIEFGDLRQLMAGIPQINRLKFGGYFIEYLAAGNIPSELPIPCTNLTFLRINVGFSRSKEVSLLLCLVRSAPNLEELQIDSESDYPSMDATSSNARVWDTNGLDRQFTRLRHVKISIFMGTKDEMDFVKFVLLASPALECMTIELEKKLFAERDSTSKFEAVKTMLSFKRASPEAEIRICGSV